MSSTPQASSTLHPNARQCAFIKTNGARCGAPAKAENDLCHSHLDHKERVYSQTILLPPLEDAHSIQVATLHVMNALLYQRIDNPTAKGLLYGLQLAQANLKNLVPADQPASSAGHPPKKNRKVADQMEGQETDDYDENSDELSLAAILLKELRDSAGPVKSDKLAPASADLKPEWWTEKKSS